MSRQDIANLTFKVVGLYCLIQGITQLGWLLDGILNYFSGASGIQQQASMGWLLAGAVLAGPGLLGAMGVYLVTKSRNLAERVFAEAESSGPPAKILAVHALAFSVVGIFVLADSLPQALGMLISLAFGWANLTRGGYGQLGRYILVPLVQVIFGLVLVFGSHGLVRLWSQLRYAGIRDIWASVCTAGTT